MENNSFGNQSLESLNISIDDKLDFIKKKDIEVYTYMIGYLTVLALDPRFFNVYDYIKTLYINHTYTLLVRQKVNTEPSLN